MRFKIVYDYCFWVAQKVSVIVLFEVNGVVGIGAQS